jgi:hypothetical protein
MNDFMQDHFTLAWLLDCRYLLDDDTILGFDAKNRSPKDYPDCNNKL